MIAEAKTQNYVFGYETRSYSKSYTCCQMKSVNTYLLITRSEHYAAQVCSVI